MLGAWALDIEYTGIDTNTNMIEAYQAMVDKLDSDKLTMIFDSCLDVDFSTIDYDFVLTSPPYINLEVYENMTPYESNASFYKKFLIPLLNKCLANIKNNGYVCFNISPQMYSDLLKFGFRACDTEVDLLQQKRLGTDKQDKIYCWK
jgi:tRNA1(Val) A37 N6-methylase TrmN6